MAEKEPSRRPPQNLNPQERRYNLIDTANHNKATQIGISRLDTVVRAAITVFSINGGQDNKLHNAIGLATSLNTAYSLGVPAEELEEAVSIGRTIGTSVREKDNTKWSSAHTAPLKELPRKKILRKVKYLPPFKKKM